VIFKGKEKEEKVRMSQMCSVGAYCHEIHLRKSHIKYTESFAHISSPEEEGFCEGLKLGALQRRTRIPHREQSGTL
jgi:hypothetical protein